MAFRVVEYRHCLSKGDAVKTQYLKQKAVRENRAEAEKNFLKKV